MLHDPGHGTCSAAATSVQANLSVVSQLLKSATALRHAGGQEHTCRRQGNSVSGGKWLWHRHGQGYSSEAARAGTSLSYTNRTSHLSTLVTCGSPKADTVGGSFACGRNGEPPWSSGTCPSSLRQRGRGASSCCGQQLQDNFAPRCTRCTIQCARCAAPPPQACK